MTLTKEQTAEIMEYASCGYEWKACYRLIDAIKSGKIRKENYWDEIRKMVRNIRTDHNMRFWERLSEGTFMLLFEKEEVK